MNVKPYFVSKPLFPICLLTSIFIFTQFVPQETPKPRVKINTPYGPILLELYNETPLHRDNFLALADSGFYDSLLFHRVINQFMIQGGDPLSRNAAPNKKLGAGGPGYTLSAEFTPSAFHKRGALAAARKSDRQNPQKASSGSQFYIVQGMVFTPEKLMQVQKQRKMKAVQDALRARFSDPENSEERNALLHAQQSGDQALYDSLFAEAQTHISLDSSRFVFSQKQIEAYTTIGGTPQLDGDYTVFGEVLEGMDIIDSIAQVAVNRHNRPMEDVWMTIEVMR